MASPQDPGQGMNADAPEEPAALFVCIEPEIADALSGPFIIMETLRNRPDFLRAASALRHGAGSFLLQARPRRDAEATVRVGFTASKKIGNAVARNRAKRRLREVARKVLSLHARPGWDYVLVARPGATIARLFADLLADMETALRIVHQDRPK
jgi:ribonuclease P protein component